MIRSVLTTFFLGTFYIGLGQASHSEKPPFSGNQPTVVDSASFALLVHQIENLKNNRDKPKKALSIVTANRLTCDQVKKIIMLIADEKQKLEVAKAAYKTSTNKKDYIKVNECLKSKKNQGELAKYIKSIH